MHVTQTSSGEVINFPNSVSIDISYRNSKTYMERGSFDSKCVTRASAWHQIVVQHNNKICALERKNKILDALYRIVDNEEIYPVAYRVCEHYDRFLVRQCQSALDKLFAKNLKICLSSGEVMSLQVQINVAKYKIGQISPIKQIAKALGDIFDDMDHYKGIDSILNLTEFSRNHHLTDVFVNLGNRSVLSQICHLIYQNDEKLRQINGVIMKNNGITSLAPLTIFNGINFAVLDFTDNKLCSPAKLCEDLQSLKADELMLAGNPVTNASTYPQCLIPILSNFKKIDGVPSEEILCNSVLLKRSVPLENEGFRVDLSNKNDINQFENSLNWHAFVVSDVDHKLNKDELFYYFFLMVAPSCSDIYPSYYKFDGNSHRFMVRKCFDQIKQMVDKYNFEMKTSTSIMNANANAHSSRSIELITQLDKSMAYYLLMDVSSFIKGQVEPEECIDVALERRYNAMDKVLNLNNFHSIEGLENIIIYLSSPKILSKVLMEASRKFTSGCTELRLANNKILSITNTKALKLMRNLQAIDLSNNWLNSLDDVKELAVLNIKSLRLYGNSLCAQYNSPDTYIEAVKKIFPGLIKLDNVEITTKSGFASEKNFLGDVAYFDFVEQFIMYYFKTFENSVNRTQLKGLYHAQSVFSMHYHFHPAIAPQTNKYFACYTDISRNVMKIPELSCPYVSIFYGCDEVMETLLKLRDVTFGMLNFATSTTIYNHLIIITVNGVYLDKTPLTKESDTFFGFSRTFVLTSIKDKLGIAKYGTAYQIVNDELNIYKATNLQIKSAFRHSKLIIETSNEEKMSIKDKEAMLVMMQEVTRMKSVWCTRCLDDSNWNFEVALKVFLDMHKRNEIPDLAFL